MSRISFLEMDARLQAADMRGYPVCPITLLRNVTLENIQIFLRYFAYEAGWNAQVSFGDYDSVLQEAVSDSKKLFPDSKFILVYLFLENLSWNIARNFNGLSMEALQVEKEHVKNYLRLALEGIRTHTQAPVLWHSFESPVYPADGIGGPQRSGGQLETVSELNDYLKQILKMQPNTYGIDLNSCLARVGYDAYYDRRYWHLARAPYSQRALKEIALEDFKFIRALSGNVKKCLVLDCDDVLWGGAAGEAGLEGIQLGKSYPGSPYYEFQQEILNLYHRGVILALCSKNNEQDVWEVFDRHPEMILQRRHFAAWRINWKNKADNLRQIAQELNISTEHLVFADDSEFEINLVKEWMPEVLTLHLSRSHAVEFREKLLRLDCFGQISFTAEDQSRSQMIQQETERRKFQTNHQDLQSYLRSLELVATLRLADGVTIPRISQLTQKTNQFNLTTRRYSESDIRSFAESPNHRVFSLSLRDRFGDAGLVGVFIAERAGSSNCRIDTFLMSCRVLGREAEVIFAERCLTALASEWGVKEWAAEYIPTPKNALAERFWDQFGFKRKEAKAAQSAVHYSLEESQRILISNSIIHVEEEFCGTKS